MKLGCLSRFVFCNKPSITKLLILDFIFQNIYKDWIQAEHCSSLMFLTKLMEIGEMTDRRIAAITAQRGVSVRGAGYLTYFLIGGLSCAGYVAAGERIFQIW